MTDFCKLFESCPALCIVNISFREIDDAVLRALARCRPQLHNLNILGCTGYTPTRLSELANHAIKLKRLKLSNRELSVELRELFAVYGCPALGVARSPC